jgi:protein-S-isoprenylcysteine O-methyltransferase Ste14
LKDIDRWMKKHRTRLSGVLGILLFMLSRPTTETLLYGIFPVLVGESLRIWSSGHIHKNRILTVTGPYSLSRNPLYVGSFMLGTGFMVAMGVVWIAATFLLFYACVYWYTIRWEEKKLAREFPEGWEEYKGAVPRFLPLFSLPVYRAGDFSWAQVTKNRELLNGSVVLVVYILLWAKAIFMG